MARDPHEDAGRPAATLPSALEHFDAVVGRDRRIALFLDYDGTLTPIVERPEDAILSASMRALVRELAGLCPVTIVSGRDRRTVEELVAVEGVGYVGSHGFDIVGPGRSGVRRQVAEDFMRDLDEVETALRRELSPIEGALVERKRFSVAAHVRLVAESERTRVERSVDDALASHPRLCKRGGKAVFELRPDVDWDKGRSVLWLIDVLELADARAIHVGDDLTDEDVFRALSGRGVGIYVGDESRPTAASYRLRDTGEVERFLRRLAALLRERAS